MKIDFKALAKFEKNNATNYISNSAIQQMVDTVINHKGATGNEPFVPHNYLIAYETLKDMKIIVEDQPAKIQQLNS